MPDKGADTATLSKEAGGSWEITLLDSHLPIRDKATLTGISSMLIEVTLKCPRPICRYCYRRWGGKGDSGVCTTGAHIPFKDVMDALQWTVHHTDATNVTFLGGEPLLYPHLEEAIREAIKLGLTVDIITCGKVGSDPIGKANRKMMVEAWEAGWLEIELSFHPGKNERAFRELFAELARRVPDWVANLQKRKEALEAVVGRTRELAIVSDRLESLAFSSTVTIDEKAFRTRGELKRIYRELFFTNGRFNEETVTVTVNGRKRSFEQGYAYYRRQMAAAFPKEGQGGMYTSTLTWTLVEGEAKFGAEKYRARVWSAIGISFPPQGRRETTEAGYIIRDVIHPQGTEQRNLICNTTAISVNEEPRTVEMGDSSYLIRVDGELVDATPSCIVVARGFCNIKKHKRPKAIFQAAADRVAFVRETIISIMARRAEHAGNELFKCKLDETYPKTKEGHEWVCISCPFDVACAACQRYTRQK